MSRIGNKSLLDNPVVAFLVGLLLVIYGFHSAGEFRELRSHCTGTTSGKIFYSYRVGSGKSRRYKADASFVVNDKEYILTTASRKRRYTEGKEISIRYNPNDPKENYSPTYPPDTGTGSVIIGVILIGMSGLWLLNKVRKPRDELPDSYE